MTESDRLNTALETIGWSARELARRLDHAHASTRQMRSGKRHVPDPLVIWIEAIAAEVGDVAWPNLDDDASDLPPDVSARLLIEIGWDFDEAANRLAGGNRSAMARMLDGRLPLPVSIARYLQTVAALIQAHPARPPGWGSPGRHRAAARDP
jgi:hypothetical protein